MGTLRESGIHAAILAAGVALMASVPRPAAAQDVSVRAYVTPGTTVGVGRQFVLNVEVSGTRSVEGHPEPPDLQFARYLGSGSSTSVQIVNGRTTASATTQYRYQALTKGTFEIPALTIRTGGAEYATEPITLTVADAPAPTSGDPRPRATAGGLGPDDLFVTVDASKRTVRIGEPLIVEYRIWTRADVASYSFTDVPEPEGFWVEEVDQGAQPEVEQRTRSGSTYTTAVIRRIALIPSAAGPHTLEPLGVEAQLRVRRRGGDPFERFFGGGSLFGSSLEPVTVLSDSLTVNVEPLPPGRPEPFSGVVGSLEVTTSLDHDSVDANDAVTLTVRVSGRGNIAAVPAPDLDLPADFEAFPPEASSSVRPSGGTLRGSKTFEYVLIPRAPGHREIPAVSFGYYDTAADRFRTATAGPVELTVTGTALEGPAQIARGGVAQLREDIRFIHLSPAILRPARRMIFAGAAFWLWFLLPMLGVGGALALRRHQDRLQGDVAYARGRRASRVAKKRLREARRLTAGGDARTFYAEVARALRGFVADRLNLSEAGLQLEELGARLSDAGVAEETIARLVECMEHCDRQRFAPPVGEAGEEERMLNLAGSLMTSLDREIRR